MNGEQWRYLWLGHGVGGALANLAINAAIAWAMFRGAESVPYWGQQSIFSDTLGTTFFLPFFTCLIVSRLCRRHLAAGVVSPIRIPAGPLALVRRLPAKDLQRGVGLGLATMALVGPPAVLAIALLGIEQLSLASFVAFKASFAAALAFVVQPIIALYVLVTTGAQEGVSVEGTPG